jgi:ribosomal protein S18 acetylase RimI-like enzyme
MGDGQDGTMERRLKATEVEINPEDPAGPRAQQCLREYFAELDRRFNSGYDPAAALPCELDEMRPPAGIFLVATVGDEAVGCGALKFHTGGTAELKRMWVSPKARGAGIGRRLLHELESRAIDGGGDAIRLDTNHVLTEAIALYRSAGYLPVDRFNTDLYADSWFEKPLLRRPPPPQGGRR